ncbi:hypothetical protein L6255_02885 [Candidatus Parcubacteria bacterium]|nr:hypothetical protein [Candidatus Parcubacteria bacterium]
MERVFEDELRTDAEELEDANPLTPEIGYLTGSCGDCGWGGITMFYEGDKKDEAKARASLCKRHAKDMPHCKNEFIDVV